MGGAPQVHHPYPKKSENPCIGLKWSKKWQINQDLKSIKSPQIKNQVEKSSRSINPDNDPVKSHESQCPVP